MRGRCLWNREEKRVILQAARVLACLLSAILAWPATASEDSRLVELAATLASLPRNPDEYDPSRGARPALTTAKHQLRDWIEGQLTDRDVSAVASSPDPTADRLNEKLQQAGLGDIATLQVWRYGRVLVVSTSFPIVCGSDDSIYAWVWNNRKWTRVLAYEKTDYDPDHYSPQAMDGLDGLHFAAVSARSKRYVYVLSTGVGTWCNSGWHGRRFQLHRVDVKAARSKLLVDRNLFAHVIDTVGEVTLSSRRLIITYRGSSLDARKLPFTTNMEMYNLSERGALRVANAAADAEDFTEQWLAQLWKESAGETAPSRRRSLLAWHRRLHPYFDRADWSSLAGAVQCRGNEKLWQYGAIFGRTKDDVDLMVIAQEGGDTGLLGRLLPNFVNPKVAYFLSREYAPDLFMMVDIRKTPRRDCGAG